MLAPERKSHVPVRSEVIAEQPRPRFSLNLWKEEGSAWYDLGRYETRQAAVDLRGCSCRRCRLQSLPDNERYGENAGLRFRIETARCVGIGVWNLVVAELCQEFAVLPETCQMALVAVEAAFGFVTHVVVCAEYIRKTDSPPAEVQIPLNVAVFVELRGSQTRFKGDRKSTRLNSSH